MTRYTVTWEKGAQDDLAEMWLGTSDRASVTAASNAVDRELAEDAASKGVEVCEGLRAMHAPPLQVLFVVREEDRIVEVVRVRHE